MAYNNIKAANRMYRRVQGRLKREHPEWFKSQ